MVNVLQSNFFTPYLCHLSFHSFLLIRVEFTCGKKFDVEHANNGHRGGFINRRHDRIRDLEASILRDICKDVRIEPDLLPVGNSTVGSSTTGEKSRLDVSAVGIWSPMERTFMIYGR